MVYGSCPLFRGARAAIYGSKGCADPRGFAFLFYCSECRFLRTFLAIGQRFPLLRGCNQTQVTFGTSARISSVNFSYCVWAGNLTGNCYCRIGACLPGLSLFPVSYICNSLHMFPHIVFSGETCTLLYQRFTGDALQFNALHRHYCGLL